MQQTLPVVLQTPPVTNRLGLVREEADDSMELLKLPFLLLLLEVLSDTLFICQVLEGHLNEAVLVVANHLVQQANSILVFFVDVDVGKQFLESEENGGQQSGLPEGPWEDGALFPL